MFCRALLAILLAITKPAFSPQEGQRRGVTMKIYAVDMLAFAAIPGVSRVSRARQAPTRRKAESHPVIAMRVDDHNGVFVYGLPKTDSATIAEERTTKTQDLDEVIALVGNMLPHHTSHQRAGSTPMPPIE